MLVKVAQLRGGFAPLLPGRFQLFRQQAASLRILLQIIQFQHLGHNPVVLRPRSFEGDEIGSVLILENGLFVVLYQLIHFFRVGVHCRQIFFSLLRVIQSYHLQRQQITLRPVRADAGAQLQTGYGVGLETDGFMFDRCQLQVGDAGHESHERQNDTKTHQHSLPNSPLLHVLFLLSEIDDRRVLFGPRLEM